MPEQYDPRHTPMVPGRNQPSGPAAADRLIVSLAAQGTGARPIGRHDARCGGGFAPKRRCARPPPCFGRRTLRLAALERDRKRIYVATILLPHKINQTFTPLLADCRIVIS
nr:hypothetical protein [uncultured Rhodopila sp.]